MSFLDFVFPKKCVSCKKAGEYLCANCFIYLAFNDVQTCLVCNKNSINGLTHPSCVGKYRIDGSFSSLSYNPIAKKLIYRFKYKPYLSDLQYLLSELFYEGVIQHEMFNKYLDNAILVPVPLYKSKLKKRGYNQAEILAKGLSERLGIPFLDCLSRVKNTKTQFNLGKKERLENMKDAFALNSKFVIHNSKLKNANIFLVDDILTSGSTLFACSNILKRNGAGKVFGLTLAREQ